MLRPLTLIGAPSNIGISPYDDGTPRRLSEAPQALREAGLAEALGATDAGDGRRSRIATSCDRQSAPATSGRCSGIRGACRPRDVDACDRRVSNRSRRRLQRRVGMSAGAHAGQG